MTQNHKNNANGPIDSKFETLFHECPLIPYLKKYIALYTINIYPIPANTVIIVLTIFCVVVCR